MPLPQQSKRLFYLDYVLFLVAGAGVGLFNTFVFGYPISSGLKIALGFAALGLIPAFDLSLEWEYRTLRLTSLGEQAGRSSRTYSPQIRRFAVLAGGAIVFLTFSLLLILSHDILFFIGKGADTVSMSSMLPTVVWNVVFIMGTFFGLTMLAAFSYARNLNLLFTNQTSVLELVSKGQLVTKVPVVTNDEFGVIAGHTNDMIDRLLERERMAKGLGLASQIQANLMPRSSPLLPGIQVFGYSAVCDETGGDFYDFLVRDGEESPELVVMVGDVTGHGVGSALLMTSVRAYIKAHLLHISDLAEVMNAANSMICRDVAGSGNFITVFLFAYNPCTRRCRWVGAGHDPGIFQAHDRSDRRELRGQDIPLGVDPHWQYTSASEVLEPGILLLGTDGIWEAMDDKGDMFGKDRVYQKLDEYRRSSPQQIVAGIFTELERFTGAAAVEDDRTVVIARLL